MNIIGLGSAGVALAKKFERHQEYTVKYIDVNIENTAQSCSIPEYQTVEEYEVNCPFLNDFLGDCDGELLFIVGGSGMVSGASLAILEQLNRCQISVLYIQPDQDFLVGDSALQERTTFGVFQQFARSGLFKRLYLVNNSKVKESLGDISIIDYFEKLNEAIVTTIHMIHVLQHEKPVMGNLKVPVDVARISTFGVMDVNTGEEKMFFSLENITDKNILYAINENSLKNENSLHSTIHNQVKEKMVGDIKVSFGIYPTDYIGSHAYVLSHTKIIQEPGNAA